MEAEAEAVLDEPEAPLSVAIQGEQIGHPVQGLAQVVQRIVPYGFRMKREQRATVVRTEPIRYNLVFGGWMYPQRGLSTQSPEVPICSITVIHILG